MFRSRARGRGWAGLAGVVGALVISLGGGPLRALAAKAPEPKAGIVPLELAWVAKAHGEDLRLDDPDMTLAGKRVRFVAHVDEVGRDSAGADFVALRDGDERLLLRLPGPLEDPSRIAGAESWEVIARLDRPVTLADGRAAIAVAPDVLVKTPAPPSEVRPGDVIIRAAGMDSFVDPKLEDFESTEPLYRLRVVKPGRDTRAYYTLPGMSGLAYLKDDSGHRFLDAQTVDRAEDGRERATRCKFRLLDGRLRNLAYGTVDLSPSGERTREEWIDFEDDEFHDKWSARKRRFPANTYADACLGLAMSGFPFGQAKLVRFFLWSETRMAIPMYAYLDGEETIDVRGRSERAFRVKVGLDVRESAKAIDVPEVWRHHAEAGGEVWFAGETTYWIAAEAPHVLLRYRGLLGGAGAPEVEIVRRPG